MCTPLVLVISQASMYTPSDGEITCLCVHEQWWRDHRPLCTFQQQRQRDHIPLCRHLVMERSHTSMYTPSGGETTYLYVHPYQCFNLLNLNVYCIPSTVNIIPIVVILDYVHCPLHPPKSMFRPRILDYLFCQTAPLVCSLHNHMPLSPLLVLNVSILHGRQTYVLLLFDTQPQSNVQSLLFPLLSILKSEWTIELLV